MKVLLANDSFPPLIDGVANTVMNYAEVINSKHGQSMVVTPEFPGYGDSNLSYPVVRYKSLYAGHKLGYRVGVPFFESTVNKCAKFEPELIHSHCPMVSTILARELRSTINKPIILTYHTKFDIEIERMIKLKLLQEQFIYIMIDNVSTCDEVWVVSRGAGENLKSMGYKGDYRVIHNGVDMPRKPQDEAIVSKIRNEYNLNDKNIPVFMTVGRMHWYKGHRLTLDSLKKVHDSGKDFRMVFIGDGPDKPAIEKYAQDLGFGDKCIFTGAIHDRELLRNWYCIGDLFMFASTYDTNGIVVREAAACELASLLIAGSCAAEDIVDGHTGLFTEENSDSMASVIMDMCDHPEKMKEIGRNAANEIYLSWEDAIETAIMYYGETLDKSRRGIAERKYVPLDLSFEAMGHIYKSFGVIRQMWNTASDKTSDYIDSQRERLNASAKQIKDKYDAFKRDFKL